MDIQVLEGHFQVAAEGQAHDGHAGHLLGLVSAVVHDVLARAVSRMLLTVQLNAGAANRTE